MLPASRCEVLRRDRGGEHGAAEAIARCAPRGAAGRPAARRVPITTSAGDARARRARPAAASHHSSSTGRVTSTWNCRPQVRRADAEGLHARRRCAPAAPRRPAAGIRSCAIPGRRARAARRPAADRSSAASSNSIGTQPTSTAGMRCALPPSACAISCAPRQMPSTGRPRACASAMSSRSRSSGASPSVPSGLTMPPSTISAVERSRRRLGLARARTTSRCARRARASGGSSAASGESRSCWTTRTVGFALTPQSSPIGAPAAPSREGTAMRASVLLAMGLLYIVWGSTYLAIRVTVETMQPLAAAGIRFILAGAAHARRAGGARAPRRACRARSRGARRCDRRDLAADRRRRPRHDHGVARPVEPHGRARLDRRRSGSSATGRWRASASAAARSPAPTLGVVGVIVLLSPEHLGRRQPLAAAGDRARRSSGARARSTAGG